MELFLPRTQEYMVMKILAIDLGKYKSVACNYVTTASTADITVGFRLRFVFFATNDLGWVELARSIVAHWLRRLQAFVATGSATFTSWRARPRDLHGDFP